MLASLLARLLTSPLPRATLATVQNQKIFIVGLPRTGTTSVCMHFLAMGYTVAHTAYRSHVFVRADVVADTPVFADYEKIHRDYPNSKFLYLNRSAESWLPSIRRLLKSMRKKHLTDSDFFQSDVLRCFSAVFPNFLEKTFFEDEYLLTAYQQHKDALRSYFDKQAHCFHEVNISEQSAVAQITAFVGKSGSFDTLSPLPHVNRGRRITYWDEVKHPNKVSSI